MVLCSESWPQLDKDEKKPNIFLAQSGGYKAHIVNIHSRRPLEERGQWQSKFDMWAQFIYLLKFSYGEHSLHYDQDSG